MKLLTSYQIKEWDRYTIANEPIASVNLMERAAISCCNWLLSTFANKEFYIFCGSGNNGGDGLAIARLMHKQNRQVTVFILDECNNASPDFNLNLNRIKECIGVPLSYLEEDCHLPAIPNNIIIVDALFGIGLNRKLEGLAEKLVTHLNNATNCIVSIDMPSGLLADTSSLGFSVINASHVLTFQCLKMAFLLAENEMHFGKVHILDIGLHPDFLNDISSNHELTDAQFFRLVYKKRKAFSHKGSYGHALVIAGSYGKMGAAVLCVKACLRSGVGLVTTHVPGLGVDILQISAPEAMCIADENDIVIANIDYEINSYDAIGIGSGIGTGEATAELLLNVLTNYNKPLVIDADALNIISKNKDWLCLIPANSILTPHPKEFARLFGQQPNDFERIKTVLQKSVELNVVIVLKGHNSFIATPSGKGYFNTTGNAGMATGGSGDVLTGIITGLLSQGYKSEQAAILGVYIHGMAGDKVAERIGMTAVVAGDLIEGLKGLIDESFE